MRLPTVTTRGRRARATAFASTSARTSKSISRSTAPAQTSPRSARCCARGRRCSAPATAHLQTDECGALERFTGSKVIPIATRDGKLRPADIEPYLHLRRRRPLPAAARSLDLAGDGVRRRLRNRRAARAVPLRARSRPDRSPRRRAPLERRGRARRTVCARRPSTRASTCSPSAARRTA